MAGVTLNSPLPLVAFSKNPIVLQLKSDNYLATAPVFSVNAVSFPGAIAADATILISCTAGSATMTAAAVPDDSGNQFPAGDGSDAYVTSLRDYFQSNYFIDQVFVVTVDLTGADPALKFTARVASSDYDFTPTTNQTLITPGTTGSPKPNFMHHIEVWKKSNSGADQKVYDANVALDEPRTGTTTLDISESLHSFMLLDNPFLITGYWQPCSKSCFQYYVKYAQFYGADPAVQKLHTTGLYTVVYGGYSNLALQQISDRVNYLSKYLLPDPSLYPFQRWLETWPIDDFTIKTNQPQFLYFVNTYITETLAIKVDLVFADDSPQTIYLSGGEILPLQKVGIGCRYQQLGLQAYGSSANRVKRYTITLVESVSHETRSQPKRFTIDRNYEEYTRYFLYSDSAGNFKTLHTSGKSALTSEVEFDVTTFQPDVATLPEFGNIVNSNIKAVLNDQVNTGYIVSREVYDALVELQLAKQIFRVFGNKLTPIVGTAKKFPFSIDGENVSAWVFEYRLAYDEDLHTAPSYALDVPSLTQSQQAIEI